MKKFFSLMFLFLFVAAPAVAGNFNEMLVSVCGSDNEYYQLDKSGRHCLVCDDDKGDAPAKTRVYWMDDNASVYSRRCYIDGCIGFGCDDYWTAKEQVPQCTYHKCNTPSMKLPGNHSVYICGKANQPITSWYDSVIVGGGTSNAVGCYFVACDANHPVGAKRNVAKCGDGIDPNATKCEDVCILEAPGSKKAKWQTYVTACKEGMKPGGYREHGYTNCVGGAATNVSVKKDCASYGLNQTESKEIPCSEAGIKWGKKCYVRCNSNNSTTFYTTECLYGKPYNQVPGGDSVWKGKYLNCPPKPTNSACPKGSSEAYITHEACLNKGTFECTKWANNGIQCLCGKCVQKTAEVVGEKFECDESVLGIIQAWSDECKNKKPDVVSMVDKIIELCKSDDRTYEAFNTLHSTLLAMNPEGCATDTLAAVSMAESKVKAAVALLRETFGDLEVSKWKSEDGTFNTARLTSDSIAGVVLGTAGGLITSHVVKKHQVEDGFEDLQCVIGGQTVAGWGDEFTVGVQ